MAIIVAAAAVPAGAQDLRQWEWKRVAERDPAGPTRVSLGGGFIGKLKLIDHFISASQRYRNAAGKPKKRLYQVTGALSIRLDDGYEIDTVACRIKSPDGRFVPLTTGTRAFFPQPADPSGESAGGGSVGIALGPISVSVPVPQLDLFSGPAPPTITWPTPGTSAKHEWTWEFDGEPNDELLPYAAHWVRDHRGISYRVTCNVDVSGFGAEGGGRIVMEKRVPTP